MSFRNLANLPTIGGSQCAKASNISDWGGPLDVYGECLELVSKEETDAMRWGKKLEPLILDEFNIKNESRILTLDKHPGRSFHGERSWARVSPDGLVTFNDGTGRAVLEAKAISGRSYRSDVYDSTTGKRIKQWGDPPHGRIPRDYMCQLQWYMGWLNIKHGYLIVLVDGSKYYEYGPIEFNEPLFEALRDDCLFLYREHILKGIPPPAKGGADKIDEIMAKSYPERNQEVCHANDAIEEIMERLVDVDKQAAGISQLQEELRGSLKIACGEYAAIIGEAGRFIYSHADSNTTAYGKIVKEIKVMIDSGRLPSSAGLNEIIQRHTTVKKTRRGRFYPAGEET